MSKHTPGPWSVPHFARPEVNCQCGYVLCNQHMGAICTVHCSDKPSVESGDNPLFEAACANARLIAAAPELLEALQRLMAIHQPLAGNPSHEGLVAFWEYEKTQGRGEADDQLFALAAIAKATAGVTPCPST
jgi:hypothetical protein